MQLTKPVFPPAACARLHFLPALLLCVHTFVSVNKSRSCFFIDDKPNAYFFHTTLKAAPINKHSSSSNNNNNWA